MARHPNKTRFKPARSLFASGAQAAARVQVLAGRATSHAPLYAVSPGIDLAHRIAAAFLAFVFLIGIYGFEHPRETPKMLASSLWVSAQAQHAAVAEAMSDIWIGYGLSEPPSAVSATVVPVHPSAESAQPVIQ